MSVFLTKIAEKQEHAIALPEMDRGYSQQSKPKDSSSIFNPRILSHPLPKSLAIGGFLTTAVGGFTYLFQHEAHTGYRGRLVRLHNDVNSSKPMFKEIKLPPQRLKPANKGLLGVVAVGIATVIASYFVNKHIGNKSS